MILFVDDSVNTPAEGILDDYTAGLFAVCGRRRLVGTYKGPLYDWKDTSTGIIHTVYQNADGTENVIDLHLLNGSGLPMTFVKYYDQSGNGNDFITLSADNEPSIGDGNFGLTDFLEFDGVDDSLVCVNDSTSSSSKTIIMRASPGDYVNGYQNTIPWTYGDYAFPLVVNSQMYYTIVTDGTNETGFEYFGGFWPTSGYDKAHATTFAATGAIKMYNLDGAFTESSTYSNGTLPGSLPARKWQFSGVPTNSNFAIGKLNMREFAIWDTDVEADQGAGTTSEICAAFDSIWP